MNKYIKPILVFLMTMALFPASAVIARAERLYLDAFVESCGLSHSDTANGVSLTVFKNTVFHLLRSGDIFTWNPDQDLYSFYAHVPVRPVVNVEIPFSRQSESLKNELTQSVSCLIPAQDGIWGFNDISGMIGLIDPNGWHVSDVRLDTTALKTSDGYAEELRNAFISEGKLYAFHDINLTRPDPPQTTLLIFDLSSGACSVIKLPDIITFCRYTSGKLLCIQDSGIKIPTLAVYDIESQKMRAIDVTIPISIEREYFAQSWNLHCQMGGLAYDNARDIIYLADAQGLWRSTSGVAFERVNEKDRWKTMMATAEAWVLSSGGYVTQNGWPYYVPYIALTVE